MAREERHGLVPSGWRRSVQAGCVTCLLQAVNAAWALLEICTRFRPVARPPERLLVLRTAALGDFVLSIPALRRLRAAYPSAHITLLTTATTDRATFHTVASYARTGMPWLDLLPRGLVDEVIIFPYSGYGGLLTRQSRRLLHGKSFDISFILNEGIGLTLSGIAKKICFLRLIGVYCRIHGIRTRAYPKLFPKVQQGERRLEHHVLAIIRSVEECRVVANSPAIPVAFQLDVAVEAESWVEAKLSELDCQSDDLIIVAPGSRLEFKRWPSDGFVQVIVALLEKPGVWVILVGSGPEGDTVEWVDANCRAALGVTSRLYNLAGQTSLMQLAALLSRASVFLGNDGGTCHLAAAMGCRVVSISNGAEIPDSVEPWGNQRFTARFDVPCAYCYCFTHCPKNDNRCVTGITSTHVLKLIEAALDECNPERAPSTKSN